MIDYKQLAIDCEEYASACHRSKLWALASHERACRDAILKLMSERYNLSVLYKETKKLYTDSKFREEKEAQRAFDLESVMQQVCKERDLGRKEIVCLKATRDVLQDSITRALEEIEKLKHECRMAEERAKRAEAEARCARQTIEADRVLEREGRRLEADL